ncbi:MAG: MFS transporter [Actinomycetes bacterium]
MSAASEALQETARSLRTVYANPGLRRVNAALAGSLIGDWAMGTAVAVWAYGVGGAGLVGLWGVLRLGSMTVVTPFAGTIVDRYPRVRVMVTSDVCRAVVVTLAALAIVADQTVLVFALGLLAGILGSPFRPAQMSLMPSLAERPDELTASNGVASTLESIAFFLGPAIAGFLLAVTQVWVVFLVNVASFLWSAALVVGIRERRTDGPAAESAGGGTAAEAPDDGAAGPDPAVHGGLDEGAPPPASGGGPATGGTVVPDGGVLTATEAAVLVPQQLTVTTALEAQPDAPVPVGGGAGSSEPELEPAAKVGFLRESSEGFRTIWGSPSLRLMTIVYCAQTVVAGASAVFTVAIAEDLTGMGSQGVGFLNSAFGIGAIVGGVVAVARASKHRLARDFGIGVILWAIPLLLVWVWPVAAAAVAAVLIMGAGNPICDVNASTILQRITPEAVMGRVFGALETALIAFMAVGALIMPLLIKLVGIRLGLAVLGLVIGLAVLPAMPGLRRIDSELDEPEALPVLRGIPLFAPLAPQVLDGLARRCLKIELAAGDVPVREGEIGDRFYVIASGRIEATQAGRVLRQESAGDFFGEIALLRDTPRTATITVLEPTVLWALERDDFLEAMGASSESRRAAEEVALTRLRA